jgi:hypothetical protein
VQFAVVAKDPTLRQKDPLWDHVVAALNIQASQHVAQAWAKSGTVASYPTPESVPELAVPVVVVDKPDDGIEGCHIYDKGKASAVVRWQPGGAWSVAASHEIVEMLIDPTLQTMMPGPDPQGRTANVNFLLEACDPCAGTTYKVLPDSNVAVSDFCLPAYYTQTGFGPYTYCNQPIHLWSSGALVAMAGYVTWCVGTDWYQFFSGLPHGPFTAERVLSNALLRGNRGAVDRFGKFASHGYASRSEERGRARKKKQGGSGGPATGQGPPGGIKPNKALAQWVSKLGK